VIKTADGRLINIRFGRTAVPIGSKETVQALLLTVTDITESKRDLEENMPRNEKRFAKTCRYFYNILQMDQPQDFSIMHSNSLQLTGLK
jgi:hypothetical protein